MAWVMKVVQQNLDSCDMRENVFDMFLWRSCLQVLHIWAEKALFSLFAIYR